MLVVTITHKLGAPGHVIARVSEPKSRAPTSALCSCTSPLASTSPLPYASSCKSERNRSRNPTWLSRG